MDGGDGAAEVWAELQNFVRHADFTIDSDYKKINNMMDMDSLMDYFAVRIFIDEGMDWPNTNTALWRSIETDGSSYGDGKWRWINFDNNSNFDYSSISANTIAKARYGTKSYSRDELFAKLMENEQFRKDFYTLKSLMRTAMLQGLKWDNEYGLKLDFIHTEDAFDEKSKKILKFVWIH